METTEKHERVRIHGRSAGENLFHSRMRASDQQSPGDPPGLRKPTFGVPGSAFVRIYLRMLEVDRLECVFATDNQKFSICHTFLVPPASAMAKNRPSGDGIACQI